jgi:hypothetical protein
MGLLHGNLVGYILHEIVTPGNVYEIVTWKFCWIRWKMFMRLLHQEMFMRLLHGSLVGYRKCL